MFDVIIILFAYMCYQLTFLNLTPNKLLSYDCLSLHVSQSQEICFIDPSRLLSNSNSVGVINKRGSEDYKASMAARKKMKKGGHCHRYEPMDLKLLNEDPTSMEVFRRICCLQFCQRLQGFHAQVSKDFATNFIGTTSKVGILNLTVTPERISLATGIHGGGEECFKGTKFTMQDL